ncbi:MAG: hypothetical protein M3198_06975 [Actinomycetota bacterium]|nr:hypothetical protein [Actinomycetota bacterium]
MSPVTIIDRVPTFWVEKPWLRFLLGDLAGEIIRDPSGDLVVPHSLIVTQRPDVLTDQQLDRIRQTPQVGLFHISDEWYRRPVDAYPAFSYVWRQHLHSGLRGNGIRSIPLGPASVDEISVDLPAASLTPLVERPHPVAFLGKLTTTRFAAMKNLSTIPGAVVRPSGRFDMRGTALPAAEYMGILRESVFVACPMGNVHLESFRVYEALEAGAVPIVERRRRFDYFALLLGDYPFPSVQAWSEAPRLIHSLGEGQSLRSIQKRTRDWWHRYKVELCGSVQADVTSNDDRRVLITGGRGRGARYRELSKHQNLPALARRAQLTAIRLRRHLKT